MADFVNNGFGDAPKIMESDYFLVRESARLKGFQENYLNISCWREFGDITGD